jgi:hypothetical protein
MKLIGLIIRAAVALHFSGCVEHTTIHARVVTVTKPTNVTLRADVKGLPLPLQ